MTTQHRQKHLIARKYKLQASQVVAEGSGFLLLQSTRHILAAFLQGHYEAVAWKDSRLQKKLLRRLANTPHTLTRREWPAARAIRRYRWQDLPPTEEVTRVAVEKELDLQIHSGFFKGVELIPSPTL